MQNCKEHIVRYVSCVEYTSPLLFVTCFIAIKKENVILQSHHNLQLGNAELYNEVSQLFALDSHLFMQQQQRRCSSVLST